MRKGFTLIELLIVIAIIAILAAIAIPQFAKYRLRAYNSAAESDLKNARTKLEAFYTDYFTYPNAVSTSTGNVAITDGTHGDTLSLSNGVYFAMNVSTSTGGANDSYVIGTHHIAGDEEYGGDSDASAVYYAKNRDYIGAQLPEALPTANANQDDFAGVSPWNIK